MVEIALPTDLPKLEDPVPASAPAPGTKRKATIHFNTNECDNRLIKEQANLEYLEEMKIRPFLNVMLAELYRILPPDPLDWCTHFVMIHDHIDELVSQGITLPKDADQTAIRKYSAYWKIPCLINDLLEGLLTEKPEFPDKYASGWFRWNRHIFKQNHFRGENPKELPPSWVPKDEVIE